MSGAPLLLFAAPLALTYWVLVVATGCNDWPSADATATRRFSFLEVSRKEDAGMTTVEQPRPTLTADAARSLALTGGVTDSLGGSLAWTIGIVALFVPLSVWRYRRMR